MKTSKIFNNPRYAQWVLFFIILILSVSTALDGGDFDVFLDAGRKLQLHQNIYEGPFAKGLQYYYSVFFAWVLSPFSSHVFITEILWSIASLYMALKVFYLIKSDLNIDAIEAQKKYSWIIILGILSIQFFLYNIAMIQITLFLLWGIFISNEWAKNNKEGFAGILLGTLINIKIMPIIMLPYFFYRGYHKTWIITIITFFILLYLPGIFIGWNYNRQLLLSWWHTINPNNHEHLFETGIGMHSVVAFLPVYLTPTEGEMPISRNIFNLSVEQVQWCIQIFRLLLLALSLFFLRSFPFKKSSTKLEEYYAFAYFIMLIPLLLPHQQKYAFIMIFPMLGYIIYAFIKIPANTRSLYYYFLLGLFIVCMMFYTPLYGSDVIGLYWFRLTQHFRLLTIATLALIPIAIFLGPKKIKTD